MTFDVFLEIVPVLPDVVLWLRGAHSREGCNVASYSITGMPTAAGCRPV